jgi:hypothetical protein
MILLYTHTYNPYQSKNHTDDLQCRELIFEDEKPKNESKTNTKNVSPNIGYTKFGIKQRDDKEKCPDTIER